MSTPSGQDTPNDPLFGSTPPAIVEKVKDGSYAAEVLANSDEKIVPTTTSPGTPVSPVVNTPAGRPVQPPPPVNS